MLKDAIDSWDDRRNVFIGGDTQAAIAFATEHWIHCAERAIQHRGRFAVALSGGSTPKAIYQSLALTAKLDWSKVWLFWSDERGVPPNHPDSNYHMAMESGFGKLPIPQAQIFRMHAESDIERSAKDYEERIRRNLDKHLFDLVMLGLGEDGHTASLFPNTAALSVTERLVAANYLPEKKTWRMTLTFPCINGSNAAAIYALGSAKHLIVPKVLDAAIDSPFPASRIGTPEHAALYILDTESASQLK
ncbi:MAG TPA: 6-phosphogluconolactonase [Chlamydiales bacterium]|nr:6-phosphogluconolactonase [Chlamydiales bacterium]